MSYPPWLRHATELISILQKEDYKPTVSDGGPDHRVTFPSVKLSLVSLFWALDLGIFISPHLSLLELDKPGREGNVNS